MKSSELSVHAMRWRLQCTQSVERDAELGLVPRAADSVHQRVDERLVSAGSVALRSRARESEDTRSEQTGEAVVAEAPPGKPAVLERDRAEAGVGARSRERC